MPLTDLQKLANGRLRVQFGEQTLSFRSPTLSDICDFEEKFGDLEAAFAPRSKVSKVNATRFMIYLALRHDQPEITERQAGDYFEAGDMDEGGIAEEIINALLPQGSNSPKAAG